MKFGKHSVFGNGGITNLLPNIRNFFVCLFASRDIRCVDFLDLNTREKTDKSKKGLKAKKSRPFFMLGRVSYCNKVLLEHDHTS